ncbi:IclR family transcriptional regulator [Mycolicibacterium sp. CBM1]
MSGKNRVPGQTVLQKTGMILEAFAGTEVALSLSDLARATGLPVSTVHRIVRQLAAWGALERTSRGDYTVGNTLLEIAASSQRSRSVRETAMPFLHGLHDLTRHDVQLAVIDGDHALLIEKIAGVDAVDTVGRVGRRLPLHASGVGRALLAAAPEEVRARILARPLAAYTPFTKTSARALRRELADTRRRGFAVAIEEMSLGVVSCAAPIRGEGDRVHAAVAVVTPVGQASARKWSSAVMAAAFGIARALDQRRPQPRLDVELSPA